MPFPVSTLDPTAFKVKEACYRSMVRPVIEYASSVWSPSTKANIGWLKQYSEELQDL